jgi:hypothetical protein
LKTTFWVEVEQLRIVAMRFELLPNRTLAGLKAKLKIWH